MDASSITSKGRISKAQLLEMLNFGKITSCYKDSEPFAVEWFGKGIPNATFAAACDQDCFLCLGHDERRLG